METVIRVVIIYVFVFAGLRVMGKREFGELRPMELITLLLIPEILTQGLLREDFSLTNGVIGVSTLFVLVYATSMLTHLSSRFESTIEGRPTVLAHHGKLIPENLNRERVSPEEIYSQLRMNGLERIEQVRWAVLEGDGKISIVPEP